MKRIIGFFKPFKRELLINIIVTLVGSMGELFLPYFMSAIINNGIKEKNIVYILLCSGIMLAISLVSLFCFLVSAKTGSKMVSGMITNIKNEFFVKVNNLTFEEIGQIGISSLLTRISHDIDQFSWFLSMVSATIIWVPMLFIGGVILSFSKDVLLSLIMLSMVPIVVIAAILVSKYSTPLWVASEEYIDKQNNVLRERLHGIRVIRAFNNEPKEQDRIADATNKMAEKLVKGNTASGIVAPLALTLMNISALIIVFVGGREIAGVSSGITGADIFAIVQYMGLVTNGIVTASWAIMMIPETRIGYKRICEVFDMKGIQNEEDAKTLTGASSIEFKNVSFKYNSSEKCAVDNVSFKINSGEKVSFIGGTGSGKSTIINLLMKFYYPNEGEIFLDGIPYSQILDKSVRDNISLSMQKSVIYSGTIKENILMGSPCDDIKLENSVRIAQLSEFASKLQNGLDYKLEQTGKNVSGGQRQRICIARALYKDAPIYVFDDSFSALDFLTEARLRKALDSEKKDKTIIVVTQRITTAMNCDRIFVLDKGRIVDSGNHSELLSRCDIYKEIFISQTGGER